MTTSQASNMAGMAGTRRLEQSRGADTQAEQRLFTGPPNASHGEYYVYAETSGPQNVFYKGGPYSMWRDFGSNNVRSVSFDYHRLGCSFLEFRLEGSADGGLHHLLGKVPLGASKVLPGSQVGKSQQPSIWPAPSSSKPTPSTNHHPTHLPFPEANMTITQPCRYLRFAYDGSPFALADLALDQIEVELGSSPTPAPTALSDVVPFPQSAAQHSSRT